MKYPLLDFWPSWITCSSVWFHLGLATKGGFTFHSDSDPTWDLRQRGLQQGSLLLCRDLFCFILHHVFVVSSLFNFLFWSHLGLATKRSTAGGVIICVPCFVFFVHFVHYFYYDSDPTWDFRQRGPQQGGSPLTSRIPAPYLLKWFSFIQTWHFSSPNCIYCKKWENGKFIKLVLIHPDFFSSISIKVVLINPDIFELHIY